MSEYIITSNISQFTKVCMVYNILEQNDITQYILHILSKLLIKEYDEIISSLQLVFKLCRLNCNEKRLHIVLNHIDSLCVMDSSMNKVIEPGLLLLILQQDYGIKFVEYIGMNYYYRVKKAILYHGTAFDVKIKRYLCYDHGFLILLCLAMDSLDVNSGSSSVKFIISKKNEI